MNGIWEKRSPEDYVCSVWSGGTTTQLLIAPEGAHYAARDFLWRVSSATVELDESDFTPLPEYERLIATLQGGITLTHNGGAPICTEYRSRVRRMIRESKTPFLVGTLSYDNIRSNTEFDMFNSALLLKEFPLTGGNIRYDADAAGRYDKVHIVPFGEFIPLNDKFPAIGRLVGMGRNLTPGRAFRPVDLTKDVRAGVMICYEDVFAYAARELVRNGANFLLVITNDAWYPTSTEPEQHYANSVLRTVETRLPMLRCGNSNYSVLIDQFGRTVDSVTKRIDPATGDTELTPWEQKAASAVMTVRVPKNYRPTFYVRFGNVFVLVLWVIFAGGMAMVLRNNWLFRKNADRPEA